MLITRSAFIAAFYRSVRSAVVATLLFTGIASAQTKDLPDFIDDYAKKQDFHGTILVQHKGVVEYHHSYGLANRAFGASNHNDTKYKIASITKLFTSTLILKLRDEGKIDLDSTINRYLPKYSGEAADKVTVRQLLNHTSGMNNADKDASPEKGIAHYQTPMTTDALLERFYSGPPVAKPGTAFDYNNGDYIVLGKIIEAIEGKTFDTVLAERILQPLNMRSSGMLQQARIVENLADTYFFRDDLNSLVNDLPVYMENWYASGAMFSTTDDLLKFANALYGNKILSRSSLEALVTPGLDDYGFGLWIDALKVGDKTILAYRRPGQIMGAQSMLIHYRGVDITIIVLSNGGTTSPDDFAFAIGRKLLGQPQK